MWIQSQFPRMNAQYKNLIGKKKDIYYIAAGINLASNEDKIHVNESLE